MGDERGPELTRHWETSLGPGIQGKGDVKEDFLVPRVHFV